MAVFVSKAADYRVVVDGRVVRFQQGKLDVAVEARRLGVDKDELFKALTEHRSFGTRFLLADDGQEAPVASGRRGRGA